MSGAMAAVARHFDHRMSRHKALRFCIARQARKAFRRIELRNRATAFADQQRCRHAIMRMRAGNIGIPALDLVHQAVGEEEIERPIDGDRRRPDSVARHPIDDFVSAGRRMALADAGKDVAALRRQPRPAPAAHSLGAGDKLIGTAAVIVVGIWKRHSVTI